MLSFQDLVSSPIVMAIVNCTPDSFYPQSRLGEQSIYQICRQHIANGAKILDIGGYSSRPEAIDISVNEEIDRILPIIQAARKEFPNVYISIDTFRKQVALAAINAGANMVNDITGGKGDTEMLPFIAQNKIPYVLMHMRGSVQTMQDFCNYSDLVKEIIEEVQGDLNFLKKHDVPVVFDPGFGFSKTLDQNYRLMQQLPAFDILECPILAGVSRKSMVYNLLNINAEQALNGTTVLHTIALQKGAKILRVHDSREAMECIQLVQKINIP